MAYMMKGHCPCEAWAGCPVKEALLGAETIDAVGHLQDSYSWLAIVKAEQVRVEGLLDSLRLELMQLEGAPGDRWALRAHVSRLSELQAAGKDKVLLVETECQRWIKPNPYAYRIACECGENCGGTCASYKERLKMRDSCSCGGSCGGHGGGGGGCGGHGSHGCGGGCGGKAGGGKAGGANRVDGVADFGHRIEADSDMTRMSYLTFLP